MMDPTIYGIFIYNILHMYNNLRGPAAPPPSMVLDTDDTQVHDIMEVEVPPENTLPAEPSSCPQELVTPERRQVPWLDGSYANQVLHGFASQVLY